MLEHGSYGLAGTIVPDDERERLVEFHDVGVVRTEASNALNQHLHDMVMPLRRYSVWCMKCD